MARKKEAKKPIWIAMVVDESGSMERTAGETISGMNTYIDDRVKDAEKFGVDTKFWLTKFSTGVRAPFGGLNIEDVPEITSKNYVPSGWTALYDAVGMTIDNLSNLESHEDIAPKILCVIITDGEENMSKVHTRESVKTLIEAKSARGNWTFVFMGANQDSWQNAGGMGIARGNTVNYSQASTARSFRRMSASNSQVYGMSAGSTDCLLASTQDAKGNLILDDNS